MTSIIRAALQEANGSAFFQTKGIYVGTTKDYPQTVEELAEWQYNDWHGYNASLTKEALREDFEKELQSESLPFTLVAIKNGKPIASIGLSTQAEPELVDFPGPWPGSFHVVASERHQGIGKALGKILLTVAKSLGYKQVTFFTSNPQNVPMYVGIGATIVATKPFHDHMVTVMQLDLTKLQ